VVTSIGNYAFGGCQALTTLVLRNTAKVATLSNSNALKNTPIASGTGYIYAPHALVDSYKAATNWSTYAAQFRALEDYTVDGTVTGELDTTRCRVRFFNDDGTLLGYVMVPNGGTATYTGDDPVKGEDNKFTGWSPAPTNVTADMDCYAQFKSTALVSRKIVEGKISGTYVNDSVTAIGQYAFYSCSELATVDLTAVTTIGQYAFYSCSKLVTLILRNTSLVSLQNNMALRETPIASGTGYIYVPSALVDSYKAATNWKNYANQIRAIEDYPEICGGE
jgi:hypothetical protein